MNYLELTISLPTPIYEKNASTIAVSNNKCVTKRLCYVDLYHFVILEWVKNGDIVFKPNKR